MYIIYIYIGSVEGVLEFFQDQNEFYDNELNKLSDTKKRVKEEAKNMHFAVAKLKVNSIIFIINY